MKKAIFVVDMLNDFVKEGGKLVVPGAAGIIENNKKIIETARKSVPIFYLNDAHEEEDKEFEAWPKHAIKGTQGAEVISEIAPKEGDKIIEKTRYSGFFKTGLGEMILKEGIKQVYITGVVSSICVLTNALEAKMRDFNAIVVSDAVTGLGEEDHKAAEIVGKTCGIKYKTTKDVLEDLI